MAESVIDALVVTLGLKADGFKQGIETANSALTGFAMKISALALGFKGLESGIQYFENLHRKLSDLYFTGRNLGVMGTELSRLGELAQLFGGKMEDAAGSVNNLQSAVFNLRFKGQMSESLLMLQRFGISYLTAQGQARDQEAIARDAAVAIERQARISGLDSGQRFQLAMSFGLQGGLASAAAAGPRDFDAQLARAQRDQAGLTEGALRGQAMLNRDITSRRAQREAEWAQVLNQIVPQLEDFNELLQQLAKVAIPTLGEGIDISKHAFTAMAHAATSAANALEKFKNATVLPPETSKEKPVSIYSPFRYFWRLGEHVDDKIAEQLENILSPGASMFRVPKELQIHPFGATPTPGLNAKPNVTIPHAPVTPTAPRPSADSGTKPTAMNSSGTGTTITFENVTVNSRGQDGATLARDFTTDVRRRINAAGADMGQS